MMHNEMIIRDFFLNSIFQFQTQRKNFLVERVPLRTSIYFKHHYQHSAIVPIISKREVFQETSSTYFTYIKFDLFVI